MRWQWLNVLDAGFNLHLRADHIASAWVVGKPTGDGLVTSLELFDPQGETIAMFFGERKPGRQELATWRSLIDAVARETTLMRRERHAHGPPPLVVDARRGWCRCENICLCSARFGRRIDTGRIVSVGGALTETLYALGAQDDLVGVDTTSLYPAVARALPSVGYARSLLGRRRAVLATDAGCRVRRCRPPAVR